ncbi:RNA-binding transcriptional accessory protein OS=Lysinibacillus sphaericus OX=1421 GN=LS41612_02625 PE=4 SV=1 [Lysinibacillus sphaericus]
MENVATVEDAIAGARDILAERFADDASIRQKIRTFSWKEGMLTTALKNAELDEKKVFEMYYEYEEPVNRIVPHRILAVNRGEKEDVLKVAIQVPIEFEY